jgi:hypothetical protein
VQARPPKSPRLWATTRAGPPAQLQQRRTMEQLATALRGLLDVTREPESPHKYAHIRAACYPLSPLHLDPTNPSPQLLLDPGNPNVPAPGLPEPLLDLLDKIRHPGPDWFRTHQAKAEKLLAKAIAAASPRAVRSRRLAARRGYRKGDKLARACDLIAEAPWLTREEVLERMRRSRLPCSRSLLSHPKYKEAERAAKEKEAKSRARRDHL